MILAISQILGNAFAQGGNLQFNQVINHNLTGVQDIILAAGGPVYPVFQTLTFTVPNGKVWKIESASVNLKPEINPSGTVFYYNKFDQTVLTLNNIELVKEVSGDINFSSYYSQGSQNPSVNIKYPFWIQAGTYVLRLIGQYDNIYPANRSYRAYGFLSAIEYNIVP